MKKILCGAIIFTIATQFAVADINNTFRRSCDSAWKDASTQYSPPILANGDLGMLVDYRNCMFQNVPSYKNIRCVGKKYRPSIYRAGRRTDNLNLANFGRIEECVNLKSKDNATPEKWSQNLDIFNATSATENDYEGGVKIKSTLFVHANEPIIGVRKSFSGNPPKSYEFKYLFAKIGQTTPPLHTHVESLKDGFKFEVEKAKNSIKGEIAVVCTAPNCAINVDKNVLTVKIDNPIGDVDFIIVFADNFQKNDFVKQMSQLKKEIADNGWNGLFESHKKTWGDFWNKSKISIPDKKIEAAYDSAIYNLKCWSTKWSIPVGILPMHWEGKYFGFTFFNPALCVSGHFPEALKVAKFRYDTLEAAFYRTGRKSPNTSGARFNWLSLENGSEGTEWFGRWIEHVLHMPNIALECQTCYNYTNDAELLKSTLYPVISACADFFEKQMIYETKDGKTIIGTCCDLERLPAALKNAALTTYGAIMTLEIAAKDADIVGVDSEKSKVWRQKAEALRKSLPRDSEKYLPYPDAQETSIGVIGGIYPYGSVDAADKLQRAAVYDFEKRGLSVGNMYKMGTRICSWYAAWLAAAQARYGDGEGAFRNLCLATDSVGRFAEIFEINEPSIMSVPWCSSPQGTFVQAVNETLLQCSGDTIKIAPAIPAKWRDFSFSLRAFDDIEIDAKFSDGKIEKLKFIGGKNTSGREKTVVMPDGKTFKMIPKAGKVFEASL